MRGFAPASASIYAITATAVLACNNDPAPQQTASWSVRDSAGVTVVSNHPDQISRGCVTVTPEPVTAIRPVTQSGPRIFSTSCHIMTETHGFQVGYFSSSTSIAGIALPSR